MLGKLLEWWASLSDPRFKAFREAKRQYQPFVDAHQVAFENVSDELRGLAREDAGLRESEKFYREAIRLSRVAHASRDVAVGEFQLGALLHLQGRFAEATEQLQAALGLGEDLPQQGSSDQELISGCYYHLGLIAFRKGNKDEAREMIGKSLAIDRALSDASGVRLCLRALAKCEE